MIIPLSRFEASLVIETVHISSATIGIHPSASPQSTLVLPHLDDRGISFAVRSISLPPNENVSGMCIPTVPAAAIRYLHISSNVSLYTLGLYWCCRADRADRYFTPTGELGTPSAVSFRIPTLVLGYVDDRYVALLPPISARWARRTRMW